VASFREGKVVEILESSPAIRVRVESDGAELIAIGYPGMIRPPDVGDRVVINATGIDLELGTGGVAFLLWNLDRPSRIDPGSGHIMKMRYTPWQTEVDAVEAPEGAHHAQLRDVVSIDGLPVVVCGLHSQLPAVAAGIKAARPEARVTFVMTDSGALPLQMSELVRHSTAAGLLDATVTVGHAFGGDYEAVTIFSGLAAAKYVAASDVAIVGPGPGIVGTGTSLGFSTIDQGQLLDAVAGLGGRGVATLRISFADARARHVGVSHHTLTALTVAARARATVVVPELGAERFKTIELQLRANRIYELHDVVMESGAEGLALLQEKSIAVTTMGRGVEDDDAPFLAAAAAGKVAMR
jgi:hypothetical protein